MDENVLFARTLDDQEYVANMINKYGLVAIPIIDHEKLSCRYRHRRRRDACFAG